MSVLVLGSLSQTIKACLVSFMVTMREVKASHAKTSVDEFFQLLHFPAGRTERAHNLGLTLGGIRLGHDGVQGDVSTAKGRTRLTDICLTERHGEGIGSSKGKTKMRNEKKDSTRRKENDRKEER